MDNVISISDISRQNLKNIVETVETESYKVFKLLMNDEVAWKAKFEHYPHSEYSGLTAKMLASIYNAYYHGGKTVDHEEISKRTNDLARAGLLLVVSKVEDPDSKQDVFSWRTATAIEIKAMETIGALEKNRAPIDWEDAVWLYNFILPFKSTKIPGSGTFHARSLRLHFSAMCKQTPDLSLTIAGWMNEAIFRGVRLLGMPTVIRYAAKGESGKKKFLLRSVKAVIAEGRPKRPGLSNKIKDQCAEYRDSLATELGIQPQVAYK